MSNYIPTIGVEVHVELKTNTKIFSNSINGYGEMANALTNVVDLGYPGTLPTLNEEVVGYIGRYEFLGEVEILNFVVDEIHQRKGIGQLLFNQVEQDVQNLNKMTLEVRESNTKAINFYLKNGFKQISVRKHYYKNGEDAKVLIKEYLWEY